MFKCSAYAVSAASLARDYDRILASCRRQGIGRIALAVSMTGKLMGTVAQMRAARQRLEQDGMGVFALVYGIGHPAMPKYYDAAGQPPSPLPWYEGDGYVEGWGTATELLPRGWQYAVNEFGNPVFCCACPNQACVDGNLRIMRTIAPVFDEIWYDDDFRLDGDQGAGKPAGSTASCYCDTCMADLGQRVGRMVRREEVIRDQGLHDQWVAQKTDQLARMWDAVCQAGRAVNPQLKMGLMIRWGGEARDGLDLAKLLPAFQGDVRLRAGEGHFNVDEYLQPINQVVEYLSVAGHVNSFPPGASSILSETTYFTGMRREDIRKKVALALAAGVSEISYCCCVKGWVQYQDFLEPDVPAMARWSEEFGNRAQLYQPIVILRSAAAARGDCRPVQRVRDRPCFPLLSLAGLSATVVRWPCKSLPGDAAMVAITGRTVWDVTPAELAGRHLVVDGHALMEHAPFNGGIGVQVTQAEAQGRVACTGDGLIADGLLLTRPGLTIIPYLWQDVPAAVLPVLLQDIRRVLGAIVPSATVTGDLGVMIAQSRHADHDAILLINLTHEPCAVEVRLKGERTRLCQSDGGAVPAAMTLGPDEIRLLATRGGVG